MNSITSGILCLEGLTTWAREEDPNGSALAGTSVSGKALGKLTREQTVNVDPGRGFYLWGNYDERGFWKNIYLGKAGYGKYAGLQRRITEELRDERCFLWIGVLSEQKILYKGAELFPAKWAQYCKEWQNRHFKKAGASHIIWVATPPVDDVHVVNVEADLIETLRDGQHLLDNIETVLSGSPLRFIPHPWPSAACSSKPHPGSYRQDPGGAGAHYIDQ